MTGSKLRHVPKPVPLQLYGRDLPWVSSATHLGHELHENANMDHDCKCKKARFIDNSTTTRETFSFADPQQVLNAVQIYCCDFYGSMLWDLYGTQAEQFYRCWNMCVKLSWDLPRSTHVIFVNHLLACGFPSIRQQVLTRYVKFFRSLLSSPSKEVAVVSRIVGSDASTNTGKNLLNMFLETKLKPMSSPLHLFYESILKPADIPTSDTWRLNLLSKYLKIRQDQLISCEDTSYIDTLISCLCST